MLPVQRKTNTYAKAETGLQRVLNIYWVIHNFVRVHFTLYTKEVPAVSLGVMESGLTAKKLFSAQMFLTPIQLNQCQGTQILRNEACS